jgi:hypothetical protein
MTIIYQIDKYQSVNSPLVYTCYDTNATDPTKENYKYVADIYVDGVNIFTMKTFPRPVSYLGIFDISGVVREYVNSYFSFQNGDGEFWVKVKIKIKEEYNGTIGSVVAESTEFEVFNYYNNRVDDLSSNLRDLTNKPLSNRPKTIRMPANTLYWFMPYFAADGTSFNVNIDGVDTAYTPTTAYNLINLNIANNLTNDYDVVINGETYNVEIICDGLYNNYKLHFLNKWGGFETVLFNKASKTSFEVEKKSWQQQLYRVNDITGEVTIADTNGLLTRLHDQKTTYASRFKEKLRISTDWLSDEEYKWLYQLIVSPMIYLEDTENFGEVPLFPVQITNTNYEVNKHIQDNLTNLTLELDFGTSYKTQFR